MSEEEKTVKGEKVEFELLCGDEGLMKEIEEKAKSGKKEDVIESLNLFEKNWNVLPNGPARDFIYSMRENENNEIKSKAEEIYSDSLKEMDDEVRKSLENITKSFSASFLPIQNQMEELSRAFDISKQMADIAKDIPSDSLEEMDDEVRKSLENITKSFSASFLPIQNQMEELSRAFDISKQMADIAKDIPSAVFDMMRLHPQINDLMGLQNILSETVTKYVTDTQRITTPVPMLPSPILRAESIFSKVTDRELESKKSFSEVLEREEEEIEHEIQFISEQDKDSVFNFDAYKFLYVLERYLRSLIQIKIIGPNENIKNKIPPEMMANWESRKKKEEGSHVTDGNYKLIDYSDFTDLKQIFDKGKNKELFKEIINQESFKVVLTKLDELDPIRKKIAHSRPLSKKELDRLIMYTKDIKKIFKDWDCHITWR